MKPKPTFLPGQITISRPSGGEHENHIQIEVIDDSSRSHFLKLLIPYEAFTCALTGLGHQPCLHELRATQFVGSTREVNEKVIPVPRDLKREDTADVTAFLFDYEKDGWKARREDLFKWHRSGPNGQTVTMTRHVDADGNPIT